MSGGYQFRIKECLQLMPQEKRQYYCAIDAAKFICALLVVSNHIIPFGYSDAFIIPNLIVRNYLARIAVPFFFVSSGYFYFKSNRYENYDLSKMKKYISRLLLLYLFWSAIYFPMHIHSILQDPHGPLVGGLIYLKDLIFIGGHVHLWYLASLISAILVISIHKRVSITKIFICSAVLYVIGLLGQGYSFIVSPLKKYDAVWGVVKAMKWLFGTTRNGVFEGVMLLTLSLILVEKSPKISKNKALALFILSWIGVGGELLVIKHFTGVTENDLFIFLLPGVYFMFRWLLMVELPPDGKYRLGRKMSSLVYFTHPWVKNLVSPVLSRIHEGLQTTPLLFITTLICCFILSYATIKISEIKPFGILKKIY